MAKAAVKPSAPEPVAAPATEEEEPVPNFREMSYKDMTLQDVLDPRRSQFTKSPRNSAIAFLMLPILLLGFIFGSAGLFALVYPASTVGRSYLGVFVIWMSTKNPYFIGVVFNLSVVGIFACWLYHHELAKETASGLVVDGSTVPLPPKPTKKVVKRELKELKDAKKKK